MQNESKHLLFIEDLKKVYKNKVVLDDIDLAVSKGEFCTLVGPSGCGKSTLLKLILGQERTTSGRILLEGRELLLPSDSIGIVYQKYSLYPHLTILENIMLGRQLPVSLWRSFLNKKAIRLEAMHYLESVQLAEHADKYPHQLSGGMQQRVAIAQALIMKPKILLMDEPFGALDPGTREVMQVLILDLWEQNRMTIFFVTHDLEEAVFLGTRILVVSQYYTHETNGKQGVNIGSRIVSDYALNRNGASSPQIKETAEFGQLIQRIRNEGFDPKQCQTASEFNLEHFDSFQTFGSGQIL